MENQKRLSNLTLLKKGELKYPDSPDNAELQTFENMNNHRDFWITFETPEFTSLCPLTGQPDFAFITIKYIPNEKIVESKSLKLYLGAFRNHGAFHEDCTISIARKITDLLEPEWLRIGGYWFPRGGIPIDIFYQTSDLPKGVWIPDQNVPTYRGRG